MNTQPLSVYDLWIKTGCYFKFHENRILAICVILYITGRCHFFYFDGFFSMLIIHFYICGYCLTLTWSLTLCEVWWQICCQISYQFWLLKMLTILFVSRSICDRSLIDMHVGYLSVGNKQKNEYLSKKQTTVIFISAFGIEKD